ncbi:MAG TPA: SMR family transporter [Solirubrobacterales bacterium]|nr:SMR family transporter [Solirubrobacterales bacterium]
MAWLLLVVAGLIEVAWALALKETHGFTRLTPTLIFLPLYLLSAALLGIALRSLPVGTGYAVWVGIGAVGAALVGILFLSESADLQRVLPIGLIAIGVVWLAVGEGSH